VAATSVPSISLLPVLLKPTLGQSFELTKVFHNEFTRNGVINCGDFGNFNDHNFALINLHKKKKKRPFPLVVCL
jgi:hypothetical protein